MEDQSLELTRKGFEAGWHFCLDWDGLLVGPSMDEWDYCTRHFLRKELKEREDGDVD